MLPGGDNFTQPIIMSITLNNSDFQCLQDQLVDLKTKNYELAEKNRRGQADFEAAKAKICSLQLKLEEQERDFQTTSSTLRREIESAYAAGGGSTSSTNGDEGDNDGTRIEDYRVRYKKLLHKAKELQQRYEKSVEVIQNMDGQIKELSSKNSKLEEDNERLKQAVEDKQQKLVSMEQEYSDNLNSAIEKYKEDNECQQHIEQLTAIREQRDRLQAELEQLRSDVKSYSAKIETLAEERKIQDKKGAQMLKELKRQLTIEKSRNETLQKRMESLLSGPTPVTNLSPSDSDSKTQLSTSSNGNSRGGNASNSNQCVDHSNGSWSLVAKGRTSTPSLCSIESEDRETVQQQSYNNCDTISEHSLHPQSPSSKSTSRFELSSLQANASGSPGKQKQSSTISLSQLSMNDSSRGGLSMADYSSRPLENSYSGLKYEDQTALLERVTRLQHDKWTLEEKLSYMEQANASLAQDLADKSQVVRQYFMDQAIKSFGNNQHHNTANLNQQHTHENASYASGGSTSRRVSFPNNFNALIAEKPSLKKMVDSLKERVHVSSIVGGAGSESEAIAREATKKMQVMLEETLIKCLKLQDNLDMVTSELNKLKC